jgi:hypothetical protein
MIFYQNPQVAEQAQNISAFTEIMAEFPNISLFFPNEGKAPWHVQAVIDCGQYPITLNFWPHVLKAQREGERSVQGIAEITKIIEDAIADALADDINLIEGV